MKKTKMIIAMTILLIISATAGITRGMASVSGTGNAGQDTPKTTQTKPSTTTSKSTQTQTKPKTSTAKAKTTTTTKSTQTKPKATPSAAKSGTAKTKTAAKSLPAEPVKKKDPSVVTIGSQNWAIANLNAGTFRNGDTIPEAKTNEQWVAAGTAGKPAWCYYNNDPANGPKYGKLYNWFAVNDPRGLAPAGWSLSSDEDWTEITHVLGGQSIAGAKMKSASGWSAGDNGKNEAGFGGFPGGYRIENGLFKNINSIATWWSSTESSTSNAVDHYITLAGSLSSSSTPKQRGQYVRCIKK